MHLKQLSALCFGLLMLPSAYAHKFSTAYLDVSEQAEQPVLLWKVALHDLASADLLGTTKAQISWQQVTAAHEQLAQYVDSHIKIKSQDAACTLQLAAQANWQTQRIQQQTYVLLPIKATCHSKAAWSLSYNALFETGHSHKLLLSWNTQALKANAVLAENNTAFPQVKD